MTWRDWWGSFKEIPVEASIVILVVVFGLYVLFAWEDVHRWKQERRQKKLKGMHTREVIRAVENKQTPNFSSYAQNIPEDFKREDDSYLLGRVVLHFVLGGALLSAGLFFTLPVLLLVWVAIAVVLVGGHLLVEGWIRRTRNR